MAVAAETFATLRTAGLTTLDPEIAALLGRELDRQRGQIELIASENFTWPAVLEAVGSVPTNKYAEGYPGKRYYGGCEIVDEIEQLAIDRAKALFGAEHANVQPHAGAQANMAVYLAALQPGDTVLSLRLDDAQDARRPPRRLRPLPGGARAGGRPRGVPGHAGRSAAARHRREGNVLPRRRRRAVRGVSAPDSGERRRAVGGADRRGAGRSHG